MTLLHYVLAPLALPQALALKAKAVPLDPPAGPRSGVRGQGRPLSLLITGDSSALGLGVAHQDAALSGQLTARLAPEFRVTWQLEAQSGAIVPDIAARLAALPATRFDVVVIGLGVNDAKNCRTVAAWETSYRGLIDLIRSRFGARHIYASGLPPVRQFPLLAWPAREVVGTRADLFDTALRKLVEEDPGGLHYLEFTMSLGPDVMAEDGFHPGPAVFAEWGRLAAEAIRADVSPRRRARRT